MHGGYWVFYHAFTSSCLIRSCLFIFGWNHLDVPQRFPAMSKEQWSIEKMKYLEKPHSERNYTAPWKWWSDMSHCGGWNMLITISCFNLEISEIWYDLIQDIQENIYIQETRKEPLYLHGQIWVSYRFSLDPIHWNTMGWRHMMTSLN